MNYVLIFIGAAVVNNFILSYFLGICPFLGVSTDLKKASGMGFAVTFVMVISASVTWGIYHKILVPYNMQYLQNVVFILVIASLVQFVEMFLKKFIPPLYSGLGIYLPLITTNCAILGLTLFMVIKNYDFIESIFYAFGAGSGFLLALLIMAGIRERIDTADIPAPFRGAGIALITAGCLALIFMGFSGMMK
ncbi:electron transport complex protein RnfA [bacterium]|nr:electron transport complex protein RnfA [bacterium]MBU4134109.1 electron transport complex protein RnfA [bacterium]